MKHCLVTVFLLLCAFSLRAQDNPYEIDDRCFQYFEQSEALVGKQGFEPVNELLLQSAREAGDKKAETLYYVNALKHIAKSPSTPENDQKVDQAFETLKQAARENGYPQYFYFAYQLAQSYYYNNHQRERALSLVKEMQQQALLEDNAFGLWTADKYLASLYIAGGDYVSAKPYLIRALKTWQSTDDPTVRRQTPTRLYCDLADVYPIGADSVHVNVDLAARYAATHLDSVRVWYYQARLAALDGQDTYYRELRDNCLADNRFHQVRNYGPSFFSLVDAVLDGSITSRLDDVMALPAFREIKVIANLCERRGFEAFAFEVEKGIVTRMERMISQTNQSRLSELDVSMGKAALSADLATKESQISRITRLLLIVLVVLLVVAAIFLWSNIRNLKKKRARDKKHIVELEEANEKVRLADAAKTRFVQNMSHEVRTPLNAIVGFSQLLSLPDGTLEPAEKEEFSQHIVNNTKMLTMLLDDILNASAMDSGNYRITYEEGEMHYMAQAAITSSEHRLQPGVKLFYAPESPEPFTFTTDPRRVQQILINLITNACKHTEKGEIKVSSSLTECPGFVSYSVTDTGPGIPPEDAEKIFERFTKLNEFVQGTGLGLSICRDIAGRMGAKVFLDTSYTEGGSRFIFQIPVEPPKTT